MNHSTKVACLMCAWTAVAFSATATSRQDALRAYGNVPILFEANQGQADRSVRFVARGAGYRLALGSREAVWNLGNSASVRLRLPGANAHAAITGLEPQSVSVNYFVGSDSAKWRSNVPSFSKVRYSSVYPGIDLVFYGKQREFEYDFVVAPRADASRIALKFDSRPTLDAQGALRIVQNGEELIQHPPVAYQLTAGGGRAPVKASYRIARDGTVRFDLGTYDPNLPLVIDPVLTYSTFLGGTGTDAVAAVAVDSQGQVVIAGGTTSVNFPTQGPVQAASGGFAQTNPSRRLGDVFVAKLNASGTSLIFSTYLGGSRDEAATGVALDRDGNVYLTGITDSSNFPTSAGAFQRTFGGIGFNPLFQSGDAFVAKLNATGTALLYSSFLGGSNDDVAYGIAVDREGNAYIGGNTQSSNFPGIGGFQTGLVQTAEGATSWIAGDGFITKVNSTASAIVYSSFLGGSGDDMVRAIAVDSAGAVYVTGHSTSPNFPTTNGAFQRISRDSSQRAFGEVFVTKVNPEGRTLAYSTLLGGAQSDTGHGIAVDSAGSAYVVGTTSSADFPVTAGAFRTTAPGATGQGSDNTRRIFIGADGFVAKLNADGSALTWSTYLGGSAEDAATAVAVDSTGSAYVTGSTLSANFPLSPDALNNTYRGAGAPRTAIGDAFIARLNAAGSAMLFGTLMGGPEDDGGASIAVDATGNIYAGGGTASSAFPTTSAAFRSTYSGTTGLPNGDGFVVKISPEAAPTLARLVIVSGAGQTGPVGSVLSQPVGVQAQDARGNGMAGITVTFAGSNASVSPATAITDAGGRASTNVTLGSTAGGAFVTASAAGAAAVRIDLTATAVSTSPVAKVNAIVKNGSYTANGAPGVIVAIYGENFTSTATGASALPFPTTLGGIRVTLNGTAIPLIYVSAGQINAQLPYETPTGVARLTVETGTQTATGTINVLPASPGILYYGTDRAVATNQSGQLNGPEAPAAAGSTVTFYLVGQGNLDNPVPTGAGAPLSPLSRPLLPASISINGQTAEALFIGMTPGSVGLLQANVVIPASLAPGDYPVVLRIGEESSNTAVIAVSGPQ